MLQLGYTIKFSGTNILVHGTTEIVHVAYKFAVNVDCQTLLLLVELIQLKRVARESIEIYYLHITER